MIRREVVGSGGVAGSCIIHIPQSLKDTFVLVFACRRFALYYPG